MAVLNGSSRDMFCRFPRLAELDGMRNLTSTSASATLARLPAYEVVIAGRDGLINFSLTLGGYRRYVKPSASATDVRPMSVVAGCTMETDRSVVTDRLDAGASNHAGNPPHR
jgi:hypothetical protein